MSEGKKAPDFTLEDQNGKSVTLSKLKGKKIVYFYPRDFTPGCTTEACDFRDAYARFKKAGYAVIGISADPVDKHAEFGAEYSLPFILLSDPGHRVGKAWGAYGEKSMYGKKTKGVIRSTFVLDSKNQVERAYYNVKAKGHVDRVADDLGL